MKLIKTIKLNYQEGNSDKVYEVDLCETDDNLYLVNFRYGRRGTNLKEGTKTVFPVSLPEAESVFDKLVSSKTKKGYKELLNPDFKPSKENLEEHKPDARNKAIIKNLTKAAKEEYDGDWSISRMIWRAGELKLEEAVEPITKLCENNDEFILYAACYALGRIRNQHTVTTIQGILEQAQEEHLSRFAQLALMNILTTDDRSELIEQLVGNLPIGLREVVKNKDQQTFNNQINEFIFDEQNKNKQFVWHLYTLSIHYSFIRPKLIEIIKKIPLKSGFFKPIRHIFKSAELLDDIELLGILTYKFAASDAKFNADDYYVSVDGKWYDVQEELEKGNHIIAFTKKTKRYFNRRILRNLIKQASETSPDYTKLATQILLQFSDEKDKGQAIVKREYSYNWEERKYETTEYHYDTYSSFIVFYYILYGKSNRYEYKKGAKNWDCVNNFVPGNKTPKEREEAYPELWDKSSEEIILLLEKSKVERVHLFANKVFAANPDFEKEITTDNILNFLGVPFESTIKLGLEIAKKIYDAENPSIELVTALINSQLNEARLLAMTWIMAKPDFFLNNTSFLANLICSKNKDVRDWLEGTFPKHLPKEKQFEVLSKVIAQLKIIEGEELDTMLAEIGTLLIKTLSEALKNIPATELESLFIEKKNHLMIFAGKLLLALPGIEEKSAPYLTDFLQSENKIVRQTGLEILEKHSERSLLDKSAILASFCISQLEDVRKSVRPVIKKLVNYNRDFALGLVNSFIPVFLEKEPYEGLHEDLYQLFENELVDHCKNIDNKRIFKLLRTSFQHAQLLGTLLFKKYIDITRLEVADIVQLANSDILEIRELCQQYFDRNTSKIKYEKSESIKLLDAKWQDTREFAFDYFEKNFSEREWEPDILIRICDSVKDDVQLFGRKTLMKFFKSENAEEYLTKLSQHPSQNLQLFTSNFIENHATGKPGIIDELRYYFKVVLRQINKGSVTKKRIFKFLVEESLKSEKVAKITLEILNEVSLTIAKGDKARCLEIMLLIKSKYPNMPSLVTEKEIITK